MSKKPLLGVVVAPDYAAPPQAAPDGHDAQSMPTPPHSAPQAPPPASATPPQEAPAFPRPEAPTPPQEVPAFPRPEAATPQKAVAGLSRLEPSPPPPKVVAGLGAQVLAPKVVASRRPSEGQPVQSFSGNAQRVPASEPVKEYLVAVKSYEQQVGPNIVRGTMFVGSFPTTPRAMPVERRFSPLPGTGYSPDMDMGPGRDYMYAPMSSGHGHPMGGVAPPDVQRSREDFRNLALRNDVDLAKMAEMGPEVRRLLDMGSRVEQILDVTSIPRAGRRPSGYTEPTGTIMAESYERPPPPGNGVPMGMYSAEACPRDPRLDGMQDRRMGRRPSCEGPNYVRRPCSRERTVYVGENRPAKRSTSRALDLLDRIRHDIDEHCAENILEKIRADAASLDDGEPDARIRPRRNSMAHDSRPPSRNVRRASYADDDRSDTRTHSKPLRQRSRRLKKSSSPASSASSVDRPRSGRSKRSKESKGKKSRSRSKKSSSSSSSSSSGSLSKCKLKGRSIEFVRKVTERFSSSSTGPEMELNDPPQSKHCKRIARQ